MTQSNVQSVNVEILYRAFVAMGVLTSNAAVSEVQDAYHTYMQANHPEVSPNIPYDLSVIPLGKLRTAIDAVTAPEGEDTDAGEDQTLHGEGAALTFVDEVAFVAVGESEQQESQEELEPEQSPVEEESDQDEELEEELKPEQSPVEEESDPDAPVAETEQLHAEEPQEELEENEDNSESN